MTYSYFPGCTLKNKAKDLDHYARECAKVLGFELEEIENWQCCGAVYPQASDEIATKLSSVRALADAKEKGQDLITVCSACHHVIKRVNMVDQIMASASYKGAEELITACPLCMYNLRNNGTKEGLPVTYFTELLAEALGIKEEVQA